MGGVAFVKAMGCADTFQNIDGFWGCGLGNFCLDEQHSDNGDPLSIGVANISRVESKIEATIKFWVGIDACLRLCIFSRRNCHTSRNTCLGFFAEHANVRIGFLQWMMAVAPVGIAMLVCLMLIARLRARAGLKSENKFTLTAQRLGTPLTKVERKTLIAFGTAVGLWVLSGVAALLLGQQSLIAAIEQKLITIKQALTFLKELPKAVPALIGAVMLFALSAEGRKPTLTWKEAHRVDGGTILLFAGGLALGDAIFQTGLAKLISELITKFPSAETQLGLTIWGTTIAVWFTELVSNTAAANILVPIVLATEKEAQISPVLPVIGTVVVCSFAFMLPIATPPNAIVYASGLVSIRRMMLWGLIFDIMSPLVIVSVLWLTVPILGI